MPPRMKATATTSALPSSASILLIRRKPRIAEGRKPIRMLRTNRHDTGLALEHSFEHRPESAPVEDDDGEDRAQLDDDVERRPLLRIEAEQLGGEDQVAGRGDREEFGDALDDAEDDRDQEDWHESVGPGSGDGGQMDSPAGEVAARRKRPSHSPPTAASGVGSIPNASRPGATPPATLSRWSISHWSRVSGAPGIQPKRDMQSPTKSGSDTIAGFWPAQLEDRLMKLEHGHDLRPAKLEGLAAEWLRLERGRDDRLREVAHVDRLELALGGDDRKERQPRHRGEAVGEIVVGPEHQRRPDDRRLRECLADSRLALALGAAVAELGLGSRRSRKRGPALECRRRAPLRRYCARHRRGPACILRPKTPTRLIDGARAFERAADAVRIGDVRLDEAELADLAQRLDEIGLRGSR